RRAGRASTNKARQRNYHGGECEDRPQAILVEFKDDHVARDHKQRAQQYRPDLDVSLAMRHDFNSRVVELERPGCGGLSSICAPSLLSCSRICSPALTSSWVLGC